MDCAKKGKSQAIAVAGENGFTLYLLESGNLRRDRKDWLDFIAKRVKASGAVREADGKRYLQVDSIELVSSDTRHDETRRVNRTQQRDSEVQSVKVALTDKGYEPASFQLKRDLPARVTFVRESKTTCGTEIVIPEYQIKRALPLNEPVVAEFTPNESGEFAFACGMGMLRGKIIVQ